MDLQDRQVQLAQTRRSQSQTGAVKKEKGGRGPRVRQVVLGPASGNTTQPRIWASEPGQTTDGFSSGATAAAEALCV